MPSQFPSRLRRGAATGATVALIGTAGAVFAAPSATASPFDGLSGTGTIGLPGIGGLTENATGTPQLSLSRTDGLADGDIISITGSGYTPGEDIYVTQTIEKPSSGFPSTYADAVKVTADDSGEFATELPVNTSFDDVDCTATQCYVASFTAFPKLTDRSQDSWVPINFGESSTGTVTGLATDAAARADSGSGADTTGGTASVSLGTSTGLNPDGDTITVNGSGFKTTGNGIYVGIAQQDQFNTTDADTFGPDTVWVSTTRDNLNSDGSFSVDLPVTAKFADADCLANNCAVYTFAAHGSSDRSQDTATPVSFSGGVENNSPAAVPASNASGPDGGSASSGSGASGSRSSASRSSTGTASVSLSTTDLAESGTTPITVSGSGFKTTGNGVYVGVAEKSRYSTTNADAYSVVNFVRTSEMSDDGSFTTTLDVPTVSDVADCLENQCAVFTLAAHGSSDRSQDTVTDISVPGSDPKQDGTGDADSGDSKASGSASATGSTPGSGDDEVLTAQVSESTSMNPVLAGGIGAVFGAAILGIGIAVGRRMGSGTAE